MHSDDPVRHLRRQRNALGLLTVGLLVLGMAVTMPRSKTRYEVVRRAQNDLVDVQSEITRLQDQIVASQKDLIELERKILAARRK